MKTVLKYLSVIFDVLFFRPEQRRFLLSTAYTPASRILAV
ncbi:hypothetical protein HMPREF0663_11265 [Hoylesella oralis ATCC 33269]|uniref:Uncharacterized protein n=1 Tax=Hoylesella oralis ATCC 33269 TaxID=873533 RepID=E7RQ14_9BACT|nr:hypothetical protein HMPREF0663_11265 [Hoylesella oralis ATCC 33269]